jgi:hypothetical protein
MLKARVPERGQEVDEERPDCSQQTKQLRILELRPATNGLRTKIKEVQKLKSKLMMFPFLFLFNHFFKIIILSVLSTVHSG